MRIAGIVFAAPLALLCGCGVELLGATAIQGTLQAQQAGTAVRVLEQARETAAVSPAEQAIRTFQAEKGYLPPSLDALVPEFLPSLPVQAGGAPYYYNAATGRLLDSPAPQPEDRETVARILDAINAYGTAVGYYPNTLADLVPAYLPALPMTAAGEAFVYNNQNGDVQHPRAGMAPAAPAARPHGGGVAVGGGPLGEATTAIGIQQQLGNMSQGGANAAGARARHGLDGVGDARTRQQNQAMDNLGL